MVYTNLRILGTEPLILRCVTSQPASMKRTCVLFWAGQILVCSYTAEWVVAARARSVFLFSVKCPFGTEKLTLRLISKSATNKEKSILFAPTINP